MFETSMSQSNPMFGRIVYRTNSREIAERGYTTPLQCIILKHFDLKTNDEITANCGDAELVRKNYFVQDLLDALFDLDKRIQQDSKNRRHAFMFVTVPGNAYLSFLYHNEYFNKMINENHIGVYMTSSMINYKDKTGAMDYNGGAYIKKADKTYWENQNSFKMGMTDFIDVIKDKATGKFVDLNLSENEINSHMNLLINIDQCNAGVDLPALNGVYFARFIDANDPLFIQIPGRICRADKADNAVIGDKETNAYSNNCKYIKPFGYIYLPIGLLDLEGGAVMQHALQVFYQENALVKMTKLDIMHGIKEDTNEPDNSTKETVYEFTGKKTAEDWKNIAELTDLLLGWIDIENIETQLTAIQVHSFMNPELKNNELVKKLLQFRDNKSWYDKKSKEFTEVCDLLVEFKESDVKFV